VGPERVVESARSVSWTDGIKGDLNPASLCFLLMIVFITGNYFFKDFALSFGYLFASMSQVIG